MSHPVPPRPVRPVPPRSSAASVLVEPPRPSGVPPGVPSQPAVHPSLQAQSAERTVQRVRYRPRRIVAGVLGLALSALLLVLVVMAVQTAFAAGALPNAPSPLSPSSPADASAQPPLVPEGPFEPNAAHGVIAEGTVVTLGDDSLPAIAGLNPALLAAMRAAEEAAAADGQSFEVTSGWRSPQYQEWLFVDGVQRYGSEEVARQYVATPERSKHVTGDAIDIGPLDAQFWLIDNGARYGICQSYANERWHFELATEPGGECPAMKADARE